MYLMLNERENLIFWPSNHRSECYMRQNIKYENSFIPHLINNKFAGIAQVGMKQMTTDDEQYILQSDLGSHLGTHLGRRHLQSPLIWKKRGEGNYVVVETVDAILVIDTACQLDDMIFHIFFTVTPLFLHGDDENILYVDCYEDGYYSFQQVFSLFQLPTENNQSYGFILKIVPFSSLCILWPPTAVHCLAII